MNKNNILEQLYAEIELLEAIALLVEQDCIEPVLDETATQVLGWQATDKGVQFAMESGMDLTNMGIPSETTFH